MGRFMLRKLFGDLGVTGVVGDGGIVWVKSGSGVAGRAFMRASRGSCEGRLYSDDGFRYGRSSMLRWVLRQVALLAVWGLEMELSNFMFGVASVVVSLMSGTVKWR